MEIVNFTRQYAIEKSNEILALERNWKEIGDEPWNIDNLLLELPKKWELSHIAFDENKIVGYQIGSLRDGNGFLNKIIVDGDRRGFGIGRKLLRAFLESCYSKDFEKVRFRVRTDNPAVAFYDKLGFRKSERIDYGRADKLPSYFYDTLVKEVIKNV